jgi:hypothetical protein
MSTTFRSNLVATESNPAFLNITATSAASFIGFVSLGTLLYAELPITNATRFSAYADPHPSQLRKDNKIKSLNTAHGPEQQVGRLSEFPETPHAFCDARHNLSGMPPERSSRLGSETARLANEPTHLPLMLALC